MEWFYVQRVTEEYLVVYTDLESTILVKLETAVKPHLPWERSNHKSGHHSTGQPAYLRGMHGTHILSAHEKEPLQPHGPSACDGRW